MDDEVRFMGLVLRATPVLGSMMAILLRVGGGMMGGRVAVVGTL